MFLSNNVEEIQAFLGDAMPRPIGPQVLLKLYVPEEKMTLQDGRKSSLLATETAREEFIYRSLVGLVLALGPECYQSESFKKWERPQIGNWVLFKPNSGVRFNYQSVPLRFVYDDAIMALIHDPACITQ